MPTVTAADRVGGFPEATVQITTASAHNVTVGEMVNLDGYWPSAYNGSFHVTAVTDSTHFQVVLPVDPGGAATTLGPATVAYTENRATLHLHGGVTPWISDGTPYQWITPAGENTPYPKGVSVQNVPDMPDPGPGSSTFFYTNQQSARLMFYHDHAVGITRLNVYAGEAAGYLVTDSVEQGLISSGVLPDIGTPLVIQDKTFVDPNTVRHDGSDLADCRSTRTTPISGPPTSTCRTRTPTALDGANPLGRWDYGPWFWPPWPVTNQPLTNPVGVTITNGGSGYDPANPPTVTITPASGDTTGAGATAHATITGGVVTAITLDTTGYGYTKNPIVTVAPPPREAPRPR